MEKKIIEKLTDILEKEKFITAEEAMRLQERIRQENS